MFALYNKGLAYYYMKRYEDAIECFDTLINLKNKEKAAAQGFFIRLNFLMKFFSYCSSSSRKES